MTEKRFKLIYNEYQTSNGKTIKAEPYFIDTKEEYVDEVYFTIKGYPTMSDEQVVDLLNEQEELIKRLKTIREEQTETILKQKRKMQELEKCREELFIRERDTKNECRELKERNQRQYDRLKELTELMYEKQWGKLENMVEEWEKQEELLQAEWGDKQ